MVFSTENHTFLMFPKIMKLYNLGAVTPSTEDIAKAMARKDVAKIIPAQNKLGLSQQVPMNYVYLTNGLRGRLKLERQPSNSSKQVPGRTPFSKPKGFFIQKIL